MTRYTFDPRHQATDGPKRRRISQFSVGIVDGEIDRAFLSPIVGRVKGKVEHARAIREAARTFCDVLNALEGVTSDSRATVVLCKGGEARVVVCGRVVARCDAFDAGLNEAWAGLVASALNGVLRSQVGEGVKP